MSIIFFGTPLFASKILSALVRKKMPIVAVVTQSDREHFGKTLIPPVKLTALEELPLIPIFQPQRASDPNFIESMRKLDADFFVVAAYGQIFTQALLNVPNKAPLNVHASLLPKYRGAAPMQRCLMQGEKETGITIMKMALQMDAGDMLASQKIEIFAEESCGELEERLCQEAQHLLPDVLLCFDTIIPTAQDAAFVTYAPKINTEECLIDWKEDAEHLHNKIRALSPHPGAFSWCWSVHKKLRLKIFRSRVLPDSGSSGTFLFDKDRLIIYCGKKSLLIEEVQLEGKRRMSALDFCRGYLEKFSLASVV